MRLQRKNFSEEVVLKVREVEKLRWGTVLKLLMAERKYKWLMK